ncbi:MAG: RnfH family protein, partial [Burkholderiaceae bacterium]
MADLPAGAPEVLVVWATPAAQTVCRVALASPMTIADAIARSGILTQHPEIDLATHRVGVFGKLSALDA